MVTRRSFLFALAGAGVLGAGGVIFSQLPGETAPTGDPIIHYGEENCARCRMVISDVKYAAAWRQSDGSEEHFDDIGCMVLLNGERHLGVDAKYWAHDFASQEWLDALFGSYVVSSEIGSPMGYGIAASRDLDLSTALASQFDGAQVVDWNMLQLTTKDAK